MQKDQWHSPRVGQQRFIDINQSIQCIDLNAKYEVFYFKRYCFKLSWLLVVWNIRVFYQRSPSLLISYYLQIINTNLPITSIIIHLQSHPILYFIIFQSQVIFKYYICFLQTYFLRPCPCLSRYQFLKIKYCVSRTTFNTLLLPEPIISYHFNKNGGIGIVDKFTFSNQVHNIQLLGNRKKLWSLFQNYKRGTFWIATLRASPCLQTKSWFFTSTTVYMGPLLQNYHLCWFLFVFLNGWFLDFWLDYVGIFRLHVFLRAWRGGTVMFLMLMFLLFLFLFLFLLFLLFFLFLLL